MDSRNLDHINYSYTDSERAKRNALKKRRRKQLTHTKMRLFSHRPAFSDTLGKNSILYQRKIISKDNVFRREQYFCK